MSQRPEIRRSFGQWIKEMRLQRRLSQEQAGMRAGLSRIQWARIEAGAGTRDGTVVAMAKALGVPEQEALERAGYSTGIKQQDEMPVLWIHYLSLPEEIREALAKQIEALSLHYALQQKVPKEKLQVAEERGSSKRKKNR